MKNRIKIGFQDKTEALLHFSLPFCLYWCEFRAFPAGERPHGSLDLPLQGQTVVQLGHLRLVGLHDQRPVGVEELGDGFGELGFPLLFGFAADEGQLQGVLVVEPAARWQGSSR